MKRMIFIVLLTIFVIISPCQAEEDPLYWKVSFEYGATEFYHALNKGEYITDFDQIEKIVIWPKEEIANLAEEYYCMIYMLHYTDVHSEVRECEHHSYRIIKDSEVIFEEEYFHLEVDIPSYVLEEGLNELEIVMLPHYLSEHPQILSFYRHFFVTVEVHKEPHPEGKLYELVLK